MSRIFGKAIHSGFVVPSVDAAIDRMLACGIGPFNVLREMRIPSRYRGERKDPLMTIAFVCSGSTHYELIEQHDDSPSSYSEYLDRHPEGGMHHLAYFCNSFDDAMKRAADQGAEFDVVTEILGADGAVHEVYLEPRGSSDPLIVQLMVEGPLGSLFDGIEAVAGTWSGDDPVRDVSALLPADLRPSANREGGDGRRTGR